MREHRNDRSRSKWTTLTSRSAFTLAVAGSCAALFTSAHAGTINFGGRTWTTNDTDPFSPPSYSGSGYTGSMTGQWAQDAAMSTPVTLNVGDVISFDTKLPTTGGWFSDTGVGFIDNTGLYDNQHSANEGGKVQREWNSSWEFRAYDAGNTQQALWYIENNLGDNAHYQWTFDSANHVNVTITVDSTVWWDPGPKTMSSGWNISNIANIQAFKAWLWDSQGVMTISNFKQRPTAPAPSGNQFAWNAASGDYTTGANWVGANAPTLADDAVINNGGTATVSTSAANSARAVNLDVSNGTLNVQSGGELIAANIVRIGGGTGTGTIHQTGGLVAIDINSGADLRIGFDAGATGHYNLDGGELWVADSLAVGQNGTGVLTMTGGWISHAGFFTVGNNPGANGTFNMSGGTVDMSFGDFEVGDEAVGNVTISGGTFSTAPGWWFSIGNRPLGTGTATISGTAVVNTTSMVVGRNATNTSTLNVSGGTINANIFNDPINGPTGGDFWVGLDAPGQSTITGGTINVADDFTVGGTTGPGTGTLSFTGGTLNVADDFVVGHKANGTATIGGTASLSSGYIVIGDDSGITGTLNVTGGTINQSFGDLEIGDAGNGTYNQSGGTVNIADGVYIAKQAGSTGDANISGGTLNSDFVVNNSTSSFDVSGTASVNTGPINGPGAMTVAGTATVNASHVRQSSLTMSGGAVNIASSGGAASGLSVVGSVGITSGKLDVSDNKLITQTAVGGWNGSDYDGVLGLVKSGRNGGAWSGNGIVTTMSDAAGAAALTTLAVASADELGRVGSTFGGETLASGDTMVMYTYGGDANLSGFIDADDYFQIDSNYGKTANSAKSYFKGDFNYDGVIDGEDFFIIDSNFSAQSAAFSSGAALSGVSAVPEPASAALTLLATASLIRRRRHGG